MYSMSIAAVVAFALATVAIALRNRYPSFLCASADTETLREEVSTTVRRAALCIGFNYASSHIPLRGCHSDARAVAASLRAHGYTATLLLDDVLGAAAWGSQVILDAVESERREADAAHASSGACTYLVISYSGHGGRSRGGRGEGDGMDESLIMPNLSILQDDDVRRALRAFGAHTHIALVFDCCHSGTVADLRFNGTGSEEHCEAPLPAFVLSFAASRDEEYAHETDMNGVVRGAFTAAVVSRPFWSADAVVQSPRAWRSQYLADANAHLEEQHATQTATVSTSRAAVLGDDHFLWEMARPGA